MKGRELRCVRSLEGLCSGWTSRAAGQALGAAPGLSQGLPAGQDVAVSPGLSPIWTQVTCHPQNPSRPLGGSSQPRSRAAPSEVGGRADTSPFSLLLSSGLRTLPSPPGHHWPLCSNHRCEVTGCGGNAGCRVQNRGPRSGSRLHQVTAL